MPSRQRPWHQRNACQQAGREVHCQHVLAGGAAPMGCYLTRTVRSTPGISHLLLSRRAPQRVDVRAQRRSLLRRGHQHAQQHARGACSCSMVLVLSPWPSTSLLLSPSLLHGVHGSDESPSRASQALTARSLKPTRCVCCLAPCLGNPSSSELVACARPR